MDLKEDNQLLQKENESFLIRFFTLFFIFILTIVGVIEKVE